jgi:adenylate cyclase
MTAPQTKKLAILFADISGSTALYDKLGDAAARHLVANCLSILTQEAIRHQGTLNKTIGDEILCTFPSSAAALEAACAMQNAVESHQPGGEHPMYIRIGFHYGDVICEGGEIFGETVNVAARVTSITRAHQVMTTRSSVDALPAELRKKVRQILRRGLLGKQEAFDVFQVIWGHDETMISRVGLSQFRKPSEARSELMLQYRQQIATINEQHKSVVLGRENTCGIVINSNLASRQHARIELSFNKFTIVDLSSNGTYVRFSNGQVIHLAHEEIVLHRSGTISLGEPFSDNPTNLIEFIVQ